MRLVVASDINVSPFCSTLNIERNTVLYNPSWAVNLIEGISRIDSLELHVVTLSAFVKEDYECDANGVKYHFLKSKSRFKLATLYRMETESVASAIRRIDPDLVHVHSDKVYGLGALRSGLPYVTTVHALQKVIEMHEGRTVSNRLLSLIQSYLWKRTRFFICVSPYVRDYVERFAKGDCRVIENGVSDILFRTKYRGGGGGFPSLLFVGGISRIKNLGSLLRTMGGLRRKYPGLALKVIGVVPSFARKHFREIMKIIEEEKLGDHVRFLGYKQPGDIAECMADSTMLVHPSRQETFGMTVAEAMALGLPVITSNNTGMRFLVRDGETGLLVDPEDPQSIADAVSRLAEDRGLRERLAENARKEALLRFKKEVVARKHFGFYEEILRQV